MPRTAYSVITTLPDAAAADEYVAWLCGGHVDQVVAGGAETGVVIRVEDPATPIRVESRYIFPSREALERYVREVAPVLRADGLRLFGPERGIRMERRVGVVAEAQGSELAELAAGVVCAMRAKSRTLCTAESCTGGLISATITAVPGASEVFAGGWVAYSNEMKGSQLGVPRVLLAEGGPGAVSAEVARAMAAGGRGAAGADLCVSVTGIAGPGGATPGKPVGTVWIGLAWTGGEEARGFTFGGDRESVRRASVREALAWVLEHAGAS